MLPDQSAVRYFEKAKNEDWWIEHWREASKRWSDAGREDAMQIAEDGLKACSGIKNIYLAEIKRKLAALVLNDGLVPEPEPLPFVPDSDRIYGSAYLAKHPEIQEGL